MIGATYMKSPKLFNFQQEPGAWGDVGQTIKTKSVSKIHKKVLVKCIKSESKSYSKFE